MAELKEVPTEELLSFQDYPTLETSSNQHSLEGAQINIDVSPIKTSKYNDYDQDDRSPVNLDYDNGTDPSAIKSFWSIEYFQQFFNVDTQDVRSRIFGSLWPRKDPILRKEIKSRPDLYGPFWISITLIFTIAISGNIANYLQHANAKYHWKYDFHLVSYAATTIFLYISLVPLCLWGLLRWSSNSGELDEFAEAPPKALELICIYGYSLFVYIPTSVLWTIQITWLQWILVLVATCISGMVLLMTLSQALNASRHKVVFSAAILGLHFMLAAGFMLFFYEPKDTAIPILPTLAPILTTTPHNSTIAAKTG